MTTTAIVIVATLLAALIATAVAAAVVVKISMRMAREQREAAERSVEALRREFPTLAGAALAERSSALSRENVERLAPLVNAIRADFATLRSATEAASRENSALAATLKDRIAATLQASQSLSRQADEFVTALKGSSKIQGNWGEGILTRVLEDAGLRPGVDYVAQTGTREAGLPDVTVFDGDSRRILIDAKVNISDFIAGSNAMREGRADEAAECMRAHARSVRNQVQGLAARKYPEKLSADGVEYSNIVIMFMPSEATYAAAVTADPGIVAWSNLRGVVIASPQMLFGYLALFKLGLDRLQVDRNNQEIGKRAKQLLDRLDSAFAAFDEVGKSLEKAQTKYHEAVRRLGYEEGAQNVQTPAKELMRLTNSTEKRSSSLLQGQKE